MNSHSNDNRQNAVDLLGFNDDGMDGGQKSPAESNELGDDEKAGRHVKNQLMLWDSLLELRIRIQKMLAAANYLPQPGSKAVAILQTQDSQEVMQVQKATKERLSQLMNSFNILQDTLMEHGSMKSVPRNLCTPSGANDVDVNDDDDEEITSEEDGSEPEFDENAQEEEDADDVEEMGEMEEHQSGPKHAVATQGMKRSRPPLPHEQHDILESRFESFKHLRNDLLDEWFHKTRLSTGVKGSSKGMESFEQPPTVQVQAIISDKRRLLKRTQLKRSDYEVIGKTTESEEINDEDDSKNDNYDSEIFDDDDFYHQLLRELISNKTMDSGESLAATQKWLEIQKLRSKMKRKEKSQKGRDLNLETFKELVNFMAPVSSSDFTEEAKNELFASLFQ